MTKSHSNKRARVHASRNVVVALVLIIAAGVLGGGGCAYYNMLYNAKNKYKDAEKMPKQSDGTVTRGQRDAYEKAIEKARAMIKAYPESRHVDDAYMLIARSQFAMHEYDAVVATVDTLLLKLPDTDLKPQAIFLKGYSYAMSEKHEEASEVLGTFIQEYSREDDMDHALYLAAKSALIVGDETKAMEYLDQLRRRYRGSQYRLDADIEFAEIHLDKGEYDKCIEIYERLTSNRLAKQDRYRVWSSVARAYNRTGRYEDALRALKAVDKLAITDTEGAAAMLLKAHAYAGLGSVPEAIETYKDVATRFPKSKFSAEANFFLGGLYQSSDSLETAKTYYEEVTKSYPGSEYADQAIKNSANIDQLIRLRDTEGEESPEAQALRLFSLAEVQLFQFENPEKALESYSRLLSEYPESDFAPKAGYAISYIYGQVLDDSTRARDALMSLIQRYPDSQQADYAREALGLPPVEREAVRPEDADETVEATEAATIEGTPSP